MLNIQDSKIILKNSTVSGQVPTVAPSNDHTDGSWDALDIYEGEMMSNVADSKVWMRMNNGIRELLVQRNNSATGDLYYWGGSTWQRVAIGTSGQVLTVSGGVPVWAASTGGGGTSGGVPTSRTITINGNTQDLSADRTWTIDEGIPYGVASGTNTYAVTISGVTSYTDGDVYAVKFTNGNDADSTININGLGAKTLVKQLNVQVTGGDIESGQQLILMYDGTNFQCIGVAPNQLFAYVTNAESVAITKGQPVYAFGAQGNRMSVKLAYNTTDATSAQTVGVVFSSSIGANQKGFVIMQGVISGVNTSAYTAGDQLYLGATSGTLTNVKPYAPNHLVYVGIVERANAGNGQIYIKPQNGYELDELHNVSAQSPANNDGIFFNTSTNLWEKKSIATVLGYTPVNPTRLISTTSPLSGGGNLTADRTLSIADAVADGTTKGAAAFNANDFNSASGVISLDYTNGQSASASNKGFLTSADWTTFNQKSGVFMHRIAPTAFNPLDATIYYAGDLSATLDWGTTAAARRHYVAATFELIAASIMVRVAGTLGSGESGTLAIRKNNTTDFTISTGVLMNAANVYVQATGLSGASFVSGDYFELKFTAPTWATNPTNVNLIVALYFR